MGQWYKDNIQGSNLQKWKRRNILLACGFTLACYVGAYFSPLNTRVQEAWESGRTQDSPERKAELERMRLRLTGGALQVMTDVDDVRTEMKSFQMRHYRDV